jgi:hypothetical protein
VMLGTVWGMEKAPALVVTVRLKAVSALTDVESMFESCEAERSVHT